MNWVDILILGVLMVAVFTGWRTGIIRTVLGIVGVVIGIPLAGRLGPLLGQNLTFIADPNAARMVGFALIFGAVLGGVWVLSAFLRRLLRLFFLGWVDGLGGALLGLVAGALVMTALVVAARTLPTGRLAADVQASPLAGFLADNVPVALLLLPQEYRHALAPMVPLKAPTARVQRVQVEEATARQLRLVAVVVLTNPNPFGASVQRVDYQVLVSLEGAWHPLGEGESPGQVLKADGATVMELPLVVEGPEAGEVLERLARRLAQGEQVRFRVKGTAQVAFPVETFTVSFAGEMEAQGPGL